jgi:hypothetical protein
VVTIFGSVSDPKFGSENDHGFASVCAGAHDWTCVVIFWPQFLGQFLTQIWGRFLTQKFAAAHTFCARKWTPVGSGSGCSRESDLAWVGLGSAHLKIAELGWAGLNCYGLRIGWVGFEYAGLDWAVLRSVWLGWPVYAFKFSANLWSLHWLLDALSFSNVQPLTSP